MKKLLIALLILPLACSAGIYQGENPDGSMSFSDEPFKNSTKVEIEDDSAGRVSVTVVEKNSPLKKMRNQFMGEDAVADHDDQNKDKQQYTKFIISTPSNDQSFWNQPEIGVMVQSEPELIEGHKVQIFLDGSRVDPPNSGNKFSLNNLSRGEHSVKAAIVDENGHAIQESASVTFFVHRTSVKEAKNTTSLLMKLFSA